MALPSTVASLRRVGVPLRVIQFALLRAGREGLRLALALHPTDEYPQVRAIRAGIAEQERFPLPPAKTLIRVRRVPPPIHSSDCRQ